jgi:hypothetical protein
MRLIQSSPLLSPFPLPFLGRLFFSVSLFLYFHLILSRRCPCQYLCLFSSSLIRFSSSTPDRLILWPATHQLRYFDSRGRAQGNRSPPKHQTRNPRTTTAITRLYQPFSRLYHPPLSKAITRLYQQQSPASINPSTLEPKTPNFQHETSKHQARSFQRGRNPQLSTRIHSGRYALVDAGVNFKDDRISLNNIITGNWFNMKANENISGPFGDDPSTRV